MAAIRFFFGWEAGLYLMKSLSVILTVLLLAFAGQLAVRLRQVGALPADRKSAAPAPVFHAQRTDQVGRARPERSGPDGRIE
jgi:hypothetical protein